MRSFLLSLPGKFQAIFIISLTILIAFIIASLFAQFFDMHQLTENTDLIVTVYQVMGTIYAILLTFTLWGVWQNFTEANASVQNEVYALLDLIHTYEVSRQWKSYNLRQLALDYVLVVINQEWSHLKNFSNTIINLHEYSRESSQKIIHEVQSIIPSSEHENILFGQMINLLNRWLDARRTRILIAKGNSAKSLWPLLFTGGLVLFAFHGLFVANTIGIWTALLLGVSLVVGVTFYLIFTLDSPFEGGLSIDPEPFNLAVHILSRPE